MPSVQPEAEAGSVYRSAGEGGDGGGPVLGVEARIGLGIELDALGTQSRGLIEVLQIRADEDRGAYAPLVEGGEDVAEEVTMGGDIPACVAGQGIGRIGHERHLMGAYLLHQAHELGARVTLDVELSGYDLPQLVDIAVAYVTLVGTGMYGDPLGAEALAVPRHL